MKILVKGMREGLGRLIIFVDWVFSPKRLRRSQSAQRQVDQQVQSLKLYQFYACPFCIKARRNIKRLNLPIKTRNASQGSRYRDELLAKGGVVQVPCLQITQGDNITWLYESSEIIAYLEQRFGQSA